MIRGLLVLALAGSGCLDFSQGFSCASDGECVHDGVQGRCEPNRYCSFPDRQCASGRRFGDQSAAPFAGACVSELDLGAGDAGPSHLCLAKLAGGASFSCAIDERGEVVCWGINSSGQLGNGTTSAAGMDRATPDPSSPVVKVSGQPLTGAVDLTVGSSHACALLGDGTAWCWGIGSSGQLGTGNTSSLPYAAQVKGAAKFQQLSAGNAHTCGIDTAGKVWCWGSNANLQADVPDGGSPILNPTAIEPKLPPAVRIAASSAHTCAGAGDGSVWCWGVNSSGQLGSGATSNTPSGPVQTAPLGGSAAVDELVAGDEHTCARQGSSLWCWGRNEFGQLGQGDFLNRPKPTVVPLAGAAQGVSAHGGHTCARFAQSASDGVACWGGNQLGEVGTGGNADTPDPFVEAGLGGVDLVATGANHSCARTSDGILWCWGAGGHGQLGSGNFDSAVRPEPVLTCP